MELTNSEKKHLRSIAHRLKPVVTIADKGINKGVAQELERVLDDHELIKVKININDPATRKHLATQLCQLHSAQLVQMIGKIIVICRKAKKPNTKLSNLEKPA